MEALIVFALALLIYGAAMGLAELKARRAVKNTVYMVRPKEGRGSVADGESQ